MGLFIEEKIEKIRLDTLVKTSSFIFIVTPQIRF